MAKAASFPPVKKLFQDSWKTFTATLFPLFLFTLVMIGIFLLFWLVVVVVGIVLVMATGLYGLFSQGWTGVISSVQLPIYILFGIYLTAVVVGMIVVSAIGEIVPILIVDKYNKAISLKRELKSSLSLVVPLLVTGFLMSIITFGGVFVLIFPVFLFAFFFMFVNYEVILNGQKFTGALKRSAMMVSRNFGEILIRIILYFLLYISVAVFIPNCITRLEPQTGIMIRILSMFASILLGWFGLCFSVTLYKQAKAGLDKEKGVGIAWIWVISILGWLIFLLIIFAGFKFATSDKAQSFWQNLNKENKSSDMLDILNENKIQYDLQNGTQEL